MSRVFSKSLQQAIRRKAIQFGLPPVPLIEWLIAAFVDTGGVVWSHSLTSFRVCGTDDEAKRTLNKLNDLGFIRFSNRKTGDKGKYFVTPGPMLQRIDSRGELKAFQMIGETKLVVIKEGV
jgi:hypothetical protein